ncbi:MAG TPA: MBL fold metallo-hydrolase [Vicinamibacteria bacterium]|nr:MBL fold metallo-hydrolase [Vicinamibacteria bacterium]
MARVDRRLAHNAPGDFFVDSSCIDCDTCRWMAPETFAQREDQASVRSQPETGEERLRAEMALVSCPTASIGTEERHDLTAAIEALPDRIEDNVYHCGFHSESSFGATSYLVVRESGNILVDSPRFTRPLVRKIESLGGIAMMFLTHRDDVADHARFNAHFGCVRVLHRADVGPGTRDVERLIEGDEPVRLDDDVLVVPTPGHTRGSACLLYASRFLFTGDHIAWSPSRRHIYAFRSACWYDWSTLVRSAERLTAYEFEWILPGHGRRCHFPRERMAHELQKGLDWMRAA